MKERPLHYLLDGHTPIPVTLDEFIAWSSEQAEKDETQQWRRVDSTMVGTCHVSTVFLGLDHAMGDGPPILFETMVFCHGPKHDHDQYQERYFLWDEAEEGHAQTVARLEAREELE